MIGQENELQLIIRFSAKDKHYMNDLENDNIKLAISQSSRHIKLAEMKLKNVFKQKKQNLARSNNMPCVQFNT